MGRRELLRVIEALRRQLHDESRQQRHATPLETLETRYPDSMPLAAEVGVPKDSQVKYGIILDSPQGLF